ncbi:uncharacterized protein LOC128675756 [Plodia interpunctella]|uniref:uncharacterized protein LOC128675756 n=1 Tax=Plodia interpunctella TaxID=58824 RepID=UPI00236770B6|nr:uncharacterized protein LOC128675756 [Plodia interpunctella]
MDDLLQSQIKESCKLALPNGLKELMSDISREVLRAQPPHLYEFIEKYLAALLVTRENLSVASRLCQEVCDHTCHPELEDELKNIFLVDEDAAKAKKLIQDYFETGRVEESNLMGRLLRKFSIPQDHLELVQEVVRKAFLYRHIKRTNDTWQKMQPEDDEITNAAVHTMQLYAATGPADVDYDQKAKRIQAAYRAYGVRRLCHSKPMFEKKVRHHIRFSTETLEMDASQTSEADVPKTTPAEGCSSVSIHKTESQMVLSEAELSHERIARHERMLSEISYDFKYPERVQSFIDYEDENEKRVMSITDEAITKDDENDSERKMSNVSEVHFREPLICEKLYEEAIQDQDPDYDEFSSIDEQTVFYEAHDEQTVVDDQALDADIESDNSIQEDIKENLIEEFAIVNVNNYDNDVQ